MFLRYSPSSVPDVNCVLADPSVSRWVKDAIGDLLKRDPVDAARDAALVAALMASWSDCHLDLQTTHSPGTAQDHIEAAWQNIENGEIESALSHLDGALAALRSR